MLTTHLVIATLALAPTANATTVKEAPQKSLTPAAGILISESRSPGRVYMGETITVQFSAAHDLSDMWTLVPSLGLGKNLAVVYLGIPEHEEIARNPLYRLGIGGWRSFKPSGSIALGGEFATETAFTPGYQGYTLGLGLRTELLGNWLLETTGGGGLYHVGDSGGLWSPQLTISVARQF